MAGVSYLRHYYLAALVFLGITLLSGAWLRMMWAYPVLSVRFSAGVQAGDLLHAHSHIALPGWVFLGLFACTFEAGTRVRALPHRLLSLLGGVLAALAVLMFIAFARQGYAPASITLSTLHMLGGFVLAGIYFRHAHTGRNETAGHFLEGSVFWMLVASAGPLLLAAGSRLSPFFMTSAVQYYLHVLFNGWILFALAGLGWRYLVHPVYYRVRWPFWLMMAGLLPSLLPRLPFEVYGGWMAAVALAGSLVFAAGGVGALVYVVRGVLTGRGGAGGVETVLFWSGAGSVGVVLLLPPVLALPSVHAVWADSSWVIVGYVHLLLLGGASALLQYALWKRLIRSPHKTRAWHRIVAGLGGVAFAAGSWLMTLALFQTALAQQLAFSPPYPVQKVLFFTGVLAIAGFTALWVAGYCMRASISSSSSP